MPGRKDRPMKTVLARLKEPSTWTAIGAALAAFGVATDVTAETWGQIGVGIAAVVAAVGAILPERGGRSDA